MRRDLTIISVYSRDAILHLSYKVEMITEAAYISSFTHKTSDVPAAFCDHDAIATLSQDLRMPLVSYIVSCMLDVSK